jgi:hypothetical protein
MASVATGSGIDSQVPVIFWGTFIRSGSLVSGCLYILDVAVLLHRKSLYFETNFVELSQISS